MSLRSFIKYAEINHDILHVVEPTDPDLQISAITREVFSSCRNRPMLWFHSPSSTRFSLVSNLFASPARLDHILTTCGRHLRQRLENLPVQVVSAQDFSRWLNAKYGEHKTATLDLGSYCELQSLTELPSVRYWPEDARPYFSLATLFTLDPQSCMSNAGIYRLSPLDAKTLSVNWRNGSSAYALWRKYADAGRRMPVVIAMGVDPALTLASMFPMSGYGAEVALWKFITGESGTLAYNAMDVPVPSSAEIVIQGWVDPYLRADEGSYANHTGFYTESCQCPVICVDSIHVREDGIMPITVVGPPPTENTVLGTNIWALQAIFLKREFPVISSIACLPLMVFLPVVVVEINPPDSEGCWLTLRSAMLNNCWLKRAHTLIFTDSGVGFSDDQRLHWYCANLASMGYAENITGVEVFDGVRWRYTGKRRVF